MQAFPLRVGLAFLLLAGVASVAAAADRRRVIVSTDIGGSDPDDFQSMVHLLVYADAIDLEGIVSSPFNQGSKRDILRVIDCYERDYPNLRTWSDRYPTPQVLRAMSRQGATTRPDASGIGAATEGSNCIVAAARRDDPRPLYVLVWGSIADVAQALHDAPDIAPKIRVHFIAGPNKMWNVDSYDYIERNFPNLHLIESNGTYFGWFVGGDQSGQWSNRAFVSKHIAGHGALGEFFAGLRGGELKMGDTPSLGWVLHGEPEDPSKPGWGGQFVRVWDGRKTIFQRDTSEADEVETCGTVEFALPAPSGLARDASISVWFDERIPVPVDNDGNVLRFRFSPKSAKVWTYSFHTNVPTLGGRGGKFTAVDPPATRTRVPSALHPNWWIDDSDPAVAEDGHPGAKTVSRWRKDCLADFADRMHRCSAPAPAR